MAIVSGSCSRVSSSRNGPSVSAAPSATVGHSQPMIAVWEWQDDQGFWRPYSGQVCAHIERCLSPRGHRGAGPSSTSICLGQSDPSLSPYLIDIPSLKQFRQDTGKPRPHLADTSVWTPESGSDQIHHLIRFLFKLPVWSDLVKSVSPEKNYLTCLLSKKYICK